MRKIILVGGGGHCKSCIDIIEKTKKYNIAGILDISDKIGQKVLNYEIIGTDNDIEKYAKRDYYFLISVGQINSARIRKDLFYKIKSVGGNLATIIAHDAYISEYSSIGEGTIIMHGVFLNSGVQIGDNCIINTNALLEHDVKIGNHCHISTSSVLNGDVQVGSESFLGSNSTIVQGVKVPHKSFIKAGSLIK